MLTCLVFLVKGYTRKGACHFAMKEFSKAMDAYNKALELDKDNKVRNLYYVNCFTGNVDLNQVLR